MNDSDRVTDSDGRVTNDGHFHFRRSIVTDCEGRDEIDRMIDEEIVIDPYNGDPPSRRKDAELARVLSILDELESERGDG